MKIHNACIPDLRYKISKEHEEETALAIKEYDEMKRKFEGEKPRGYIKTLKQFTDSPTLSESEGWTQEKTAKDLNTSQQTISRAIQIATAVEEYPELAKREKGI